ncbi:hypothetical protein KP509_27G010100 [Ceratopteris richardii]|uniref:Uncharacterized protein n=1 Tax=Ceratopteris richardii TaxID=49495 RepID=A0A8T2RDU4_CERRI|nr:hypothetical protein KP509_27G010100 [Ceratopteris richardii]
MRRWSRLAAGFVFVSKRAPTFLNAYSRTSCLQILPISLLSLYLFPLIPSLLFSASRTRLPVYSEPCVRVSSPPPSTPVTVSTPNTLPTLRTTMKIQNSTNV